MPRKRNLAPLSDDNVVPFWRRKALEDMSRQEWESLCDGCGRCCLIKLEDEDSGEIHLTRLACGLLDVKTCRCKDYTNRHERMPDCVSIDPQTVRKLTWLPETCGYRRVAEGRELAWWHPLLSARAETVVEAGIAIKGWARSEKGVGLGSYHRYIVEDFLQQEPVERDKRGKK